MNKSDREQLKRLKEERDKVTIELVNSDLDSESYQEGLSKIERLDNLIKKEEKQKMDPAVKGAIIKTVGSGVMVIALAIWENWGVIHSKLATREALKN